MFVLVILCQITLTISMQAFETTSNKPSCIMKIVEHYFTEWSPISIFTNSSKDNTVLEDVYKSENHVKILRDFNEFKVDFTEVRKKYAILIAEDLQYFISQQKQIDKLALWNARSKYIFYTLKNSKNMLQEFVNMVWNIYIINAIVLMPGEETDDIINIYSWFPYKGDNCGMAVQAELVETCTNGNFGTNVTLFPNKVPMDMHGCPVRIRVLIWPPFVFLPENVIIEDGKVLNITEGIEVQLTMAIAKVANFTIQFTTSPIPHDWGLATKDGNTTGTIRALKYKQADIGMGSFGPTTERRMYCDHSACHLQEQLTWCVPKAQMAPRWKNLLQTFQLTAWFMMILTYIFVSIIIWFFSKCQPIDESTFIKAQNSFLYSFATFLGLSANDTPRKTSGRISFCMWLIFGLHFVVAYQAKLMGVLLRPSYEAQLSTIEEVLNSGMKYALLPTHKRFYSNVDDWRVKTIVRDWTDCNDSDACLKRIAYNRDFALCTLKQHALFESLKYLDSEGQLLVYCIPYVTYASELYMTKGYPLKDRIDKLIYRVRNSGLMFKWQRDIDRRWRLKYSHEMAASDDVEQVLTISHMQGAFAVWIIGICTSVLVFGIEKIYFKLKITLPSFKADKNESDGVKILKF